MIVRPATFAHSILISSVFVTALITTRPSRAEAGAVRRAALRAARAAGRRAPAGIDFKVRHKGEVIQVGRGEPAFEVTIHDLASVVRNAALHPGLALGEALMDGTMEIDPDQLDAAMEVAARHGKTFTRRMPRMPARLRDLNSIRHQRRSIRAHYDIGQGLYDLMLDGDFRTYSCAFFAEPDMTLEEAQKAKHLLVVNKLGIRSGKQRFLDIGSGWGGLAIRAALENPELEVVGLTLSHDQYTWATAKAKELGLDHRVTFLEKDYRTFAAENPGTFDAVSSVGMYEHVGPGKHPHEYMGAVNRLLKDGGRTVLHTISQDVESRFSPLMSKYVFPGGHIPSVRETVGIMPRHGLHLVHAEDLAPHYARTLDHWTANFEAHLRDIQALRGPDGRQLYDDRFVRLWRVYLRGSAASFRHGHLNLTQFVMTKGKQDEPPGNNARFYRDLR